MTSLHVFFAGGGTGGHLYPALAIARALVNADPRVEPFFVGAQRGIEREILPTTEFPFELLDLHPLYRSRPWSNWRTLVGGVAAWRRIGLLAASLRPVAIVATGGYAAAATLGYAAGHGIPIVIQEQNSVPGMTVRWFAKRAAQIHLGFPEAGSFLRVGPATHVLASGNPIEPPPRQRPDRIAAQAAWGFQDSGRKTLLIFGGSQGAEGINTVVAEWLTANGAEHAAGIHVIWVTGRAVYDRYQGFNSDHVKVCPYISPMANAYAAADLVVCRAGAMTTAELAAWGIPSILVPLPTAAADHQTVNAKILVAAGAATMIPQRALDASALSDAIWRLIGDNVTLSNMQYSALRRARPDASKDIAAHILTLIQLK